MNAVQSALSAINQLKDVDRLIDISKSTLQIDILLALSNRGEMTPAEISLAIGQRRKAVTDALRKLRNKGLVEPASDEGRSPAYRLTELGNECIMTICNFVGKRPPSSLAGLRSEPEYARKDCAIDLNQLPLASALSQVLFALGTSKGNSLPLPELARIMGLSEQRAESYLEVFMKSEPRLFRRFTDYPWWSKALRRIGINSKPKRLVVYYGLTQDGLQHFYRLPAYSRLRRSRTYKFLSSIVFTSNPKGIVRRLSLGLATLGVTLALLETTLWGGFSILSTGVGLAVIFGVFSLMLYKLSV